MNKLLTIAFVLAVSATNLTADDSDLYYLCPPSGDAKTESGKHLNRLKNRTTVPAESDFDIALTMNRLIKSGDDRSRWFSSQAVELLAYVVRVTDAPVDSCNCHRKWKELRSTQIELAVSDDSNDRQPTRRLFAMVTPRLRAMMATHGEDWSRQALHDQFSGQWVRIQGWLLFDPADAESARNTNARRGTPNRATAWEIHPVTSIQLIPTLRAVALTAELQLDQLGFDIPAFEFTSR